MDVARSAPQGARYHADVIYLLPKLGIKGTRALWYSELNLHQQSLFSDGQHTLAFYTKCCASDFAPSSKYLSAVQNNTKI